MSRQNIIPIALQLLIITLLICALLMLASCSRRTYRQSTVQKQDTVDIRILPVDSVQGLDIVVGQKLSIPSMDIELVRVSKKEVLVRTPVRTTVRTETTFVPVKNVDKSRTYTDSYNTDKSRTVDKDKSKVKEVSRTVDKVKTVDKQVTRNGFPWWIIIVGVVLGIGYWAAKKYIKFPFI